MNEKIKLLYRLHIPPGKNFQAIFNFLSFWFSLPHLYITVIGADWEKKIGELFSFICKLPIIYLIVWSEIHLIPIN